MPGREIEMLVSAPSREPLTEHSCHLHPLARQLASQLLAALHARGRRDHVHGAHGHGHERDHDHEHEHECGDWRPSWGTALTDDDPLLLPPQARAGRLQIEVHQLVAQRIPLPRHSRCPPENN